MCSQFLCEEWGEANCAAGGWGLDGSFDAELSALQIEPVGSKGCEFSWA